MSAMIHSFTTADYQFMSRAIELAKRGMNTTTPNPRVGCVIVKDNEIVGEGWHVRAGEAHAEIHAINAAGKNAKNATAYVTLEPCSHHGRTPPCSDALIKAGVRKVIIAMQDPHLRVNGEGIQKLADAGIQVVTGLLEQQAQALNPGFIKRMRTGRPYVRLKLAMSMDGRTAMASGESKWITSGAAREDVQRLRAQSCAIVTGVGTVLADDPSMNLRLDGVERQPVRVVVDTNLSIPVTAKILSLPGETIVMTCSEEEELIEQLTQAGARVINIPYCNTSVSLASVLDELGQMGINEVLIETGATLSGSMLLDGLIDELIVYMAPILMGDGARGLFRLPGLETMADKVQLEITDMRAVGCDWRITAKVMNRPMKV